MRRLVLALTISLVASVLAAGATSSRVAAAPMPNEIVGFTVTPGATWTDPVTLQVHRYYSVTIAFSHHGAAEARVTEYAGATGSTGIDSDHAWFKGSGSDTFAGSVAGGLVGQPVYFELLVVKQGAHHALQVLDTMTIGPYSS